MVWRPQPGVQRRRRPQANRPCQACSLAVAPKIRGGDSSRRWRGVCPFCYWLVPGVCLYLTSPLGPVLGISPRVARSTNESELRWSPVIPCRRGERCCSRQPCQSLLP